MLSTGMMEMVDTYIGPLGNKNGQEAETPSAHGSPALGLKKRMLAQQRLFDNKNDRKLNLTEIANPEGGANMILQKMACTGGLSNEDANSHALAGKKPRRSSDAGNELRSGDHDKFELGMPKMSIGSSKNSTAMAKMMAKTAINSAGGPQIKLVTPGTINDYNRSTSIGLINKKTQGAGEDEMRVTNAKLNYDNLLGG